MGRLPLDEFHRQLGARFTEVNGAQVVAAYADPLREHQALWETAGFLDFSFRGRLCLTGADRSRFLHGQVTNDINALRPGFGCYAAVTNAKGRMETDLNVYCLEEELLLDFEPGLADNVTQRFEKFIVADDVQVVNVAALYGLFTVQGPKAEAVVRALELFDSIPTVPFHSVKRVDTAFGELYLAHQPRLGTKGFDLFVPAESLGLLAEKLVGCVRANGGEPVGWEAFEIARIEAGIPRFGVDMDSSNFPQECGLEARAMSYSKGCYVGQEVLNRIHTMGRVNRMLRGLLLAGAGADSAAKGDKLFKGDKEVGLLTSVTRSPRLQATIALGYLRKEAQQPGTELALRSGSWQIKATVSELPFIPL